MLNQRTRSACLRVASLMRRPIVLLIALITVAFAAALIARAGAAAPSTQFRTVDAGAACKLKGATLVCSALGSPVSVAIEHSGSTRIVSVLPWWDASTPVLHTWHRGTISCRLAGPAIRCRFNRGAIRITAAGFAVGA